MGHSSLSGVIIWVAKNVFSVCWNIINTKGSCKLRVDAGGEDWGHWKNLLEIRFAKETTCLLFSISDFPQFIITFICCVKWNRNWFLEHILHFWSQFSKFQRLYNFSQWYSRWFFIEVCVILLLAAFYC